MKTFKLLSAILVIASAQLLSSCLDGGKNNSMSIESSYPALFNAVIDENTGDMTLYTGASVKATWEYADNTVQLTINGLKLPDGSSYPSLVFKSLPWKYDSKGWMSVSFVDRAPDVASGYVSDLKFDRFSMATLSRQYNNLIFPPCFSIRYTLKDKYLVISLPTEIIEVGKTTVTDQTGQTFVQPDDKRAFYYLILDVTQHKAFLIIQGAQFASNMPAMNMKFTGIDFDVTPAGYINFQCESLVPSQLGSTVDVNSAGTPMPSFPITNFKALYVPERGLNISFTCNAMGASYNVTFDSEYPILTTPQQ